MSNIVFTSTETKRTIIVQTEVEDGQLEKELKYHKEMGMSNGEYSFVKCPKEN